LNGYKVYRKVNIMKLNTEYKGSSLVYEVQADKVYLNVFPSPEGEFPRWVEEDPQILTSYEDGLWQAFLSGKAAEEVLVAEGLVDETGSLDYVKLVQMHGFDVEEECGDYVLWSTQTKAVPCACYGCLGGDPQPGHYACDSVTWKHNYDLMVLYHSDVISPVYRNGKWVWVIC
jgi:hypothetical protein